MVTDSYSVLTEKSKQRAYVNSNSGKDLTRIFLYILRVLVTITVPLTSSGFLDGDFTHGN